MLFINHYGLIDNLIYMEPSAGIEGFNFASENKCAMFWQSLNGTKNKTKQEKETRLK